MNHVLTATLLAALLGVHSGCGGQAGPGGRSIVVITMDTTRADHLHSYGYPLEITPNVDALAARGVLFEEAYAPMPQTLPSHATLFTGLQPRQHGALENTYVLDEVYLTLAEVARDRGYATGAFIGALVLDTATGMAQGFERFDQPSGQWNEQREGHPPQRRAQEITSAALDWARELDPDQPFLLWAHYYDPHGDGPKGCDPPPEALAAVPRAQVAQLVRERAAGMHGPLDEAGLVGFWRRYAAEILYTDQQIGRLLEGLQRRGLMDDTVVVLAGDHGEGLYEHGIKAHGVHVWQELHRIPLIIADAGGQHAGQRVAGRVSLRDIEPTLKHLAFDERSGARGDDFGLDLWDTVERGGALPDRPVFLERPHFDRERVKNRLGGAQLDQAYGYLTAVLAGGHKLVREPGGTLRLYDLDKDPGELRDVAGEDAAMTGRLQLMLEAWMEAHEVGAPGEGIELTPEKRAILEALGYI